MGSCAHTSLGQPRLTPHERRLSRKLPRTKPSCSAQYATSSGSRSARLWAASTGWTTATGGWVGGPWPCASIQPRSPQRWHIQYPPLNSTHARLCRFLRSCPWPHDGHTNLHTEPDLRGSRFWAAASSNAFDEDIGMAGLQN
jgi:hypothetical protein